MDKNIDSKATWLHILLDIIGIKVVISFLVGVPAMITGIITVWHSLTPHLQIIISVCGITMLGSIVLFINSQKQKTLYIIPSLLYRRYHRAVELAVELHIPNFGFDDFKDFLLLLDIDVTTLSSLNNAKDIPSVIRTLIDAIIEKSTSLNEESRYRAIQYLGQKTGLRQLMTADKKYQKLTQQLRKMQPEIPTQEIALAINEYSTKSELAVGFLPLVIASVNNPNILGILPLKSQVDLSHFEDVLNNWMGILLAKVRESTDSYYNRRQLNAKT